MRILSKLLQLYNYTIDTLLPYYYWYYQKFFVHPYIDLNVTQEFITISDSFSPVERFVINTSSKDYLSKLDLINTQFNTVTKRHVFLIDKFDKIYDITEKLSFYLDPLGHFWTKDIKNFPVEYYNLLFGIEPVIIEYLDDSKELIQIKLNKNKLN